MSRRSTRRTKTITRPIAPRWLLKANPTNNIISDVHNAARWLAGPFDGIFSFHSARVALAVNWGLAAVVYAFLGGLIARLLGSRR